MSLSLQSRRRFLGGAGSAVACWHPVWQALWSAGVARAAVPPDAGEYRAVVCLFLSGGNDSFNLLVPHSGPSATHEDAYAEFAESRGALALAKEALLPIEPRNLPGRGFGVHPAMPRLAEMFARGHAAFVANTGTLVEPLADKSEVAGKKLPIGLRSHAVQAAQWQTAVTDQESITGWAGRIGDLLGGAGSPVPVNLSMAGSPVFQNGVGRGALVVDPVAGAVPLKGYTAAYDPEDELANAASDALDQMLAQAQGHHLKQAVLEARREALRSNAAYAAAAIGPLPGAVSFPDTSLGRQLRQVALAIQGREALGTLRQIFFVQLDGFDLHADALAGHAALLGQVDAAVGAFWDQLIAIGIAKGEPVEGQVTMFSASEFGRTLAGNGSGSDDGWGGNHFVVGGSVDGGKIYGSYPSLALDSPLDLGRGCLIPTTGCDDYFGEFAQWLGVTVESLPQVLPNLANYLPEGGSFTPLGFLGRPGVPVNTQSPTLTEVDGVVTATPGEWTGAPASIGYVWYLNDVLVEGATDPVFNVPLAAGDRVFARISATNDIGTRTMKSPVFTMPGPVSLALHWTDRADNEAGFVLEWGKDGTTFPNIFEIAAGSSHTTVTFPRPATYFARIKAYNAAGESAYGNILTISAEA
ncbi:DUF1501 domain-containing protein [Luteolibacter arcticus]|uniref:DUF1501 domain-containing protein n=1 Tax=Luteolibacter arcticus TaxID=1581411 RepID=A0ABT3GHE4_9BACT|nr:DUF1501 domain-containing protein [Luteolibacter arcticus]MCW1923010.1 DUF1501 domain-containing protein [Luteolibacter arcticus]